MSGVKSPQGIWSSMCVTVLKGSICLMHQSPIRHEELVVKKVRVYFDEVVLTGRQVSQWSKTWLPGDR